MTGFWMSRDFSAEATVACCTAVVERVCVGCRQISFVKEFMKSLIPFGVAVLCGILPFGRRSTRHGFLPNPGSGVHLVGVRSYSDYCFRFSSCKQLSEYVSFLLEKNEN